jgi:hypothetical protein
MIPLEIERLIIRARIVASRLAGNEERSKTPTIRSLEIIRRLRIAEDTRQLSDLLKQIPPEYHEKIHQNNLQTASS